MASTSTLTGWAEQLAQSLIHDSARSVPSRKQLDNFIRSIRHHNLARTNQFEVQERLLGLEEKFQILDRDDLSDALHVRIFELNQHFERWIPDVLDLLLQLSNSPAKYSTVDTLYSVTERTATPPPLKWSALEADEPIDRHDRIWSQPAFTDSSSNEDEIEFVASEISNCDKHYVDVQKHPVIRGQTVRHQLDKAIAEVFMRAVAGSEAGMAGSLTENRAIRELLFICQGYPTSLVKQESGTHKSDAGNRVTSATNLAYTAVLRNANSDSQRIVYLREWTSRPQILPFMRVLRDCVQSYVNEYDMWLSQFHQHTIDVIDRGGLTSLLVTAKDVGVRCMPLLYIQNFVEELEGRDGIAYLEVLYAHIAQAEPVDGVRYTVLLDIFVAAFQVYALPLDGWITQGRISTQESSLFVRRNVNQVDRAKLWQSWFTLFNTQAGRCPEFLQEYSNLMFIAGKTVSFLQLLGALHRITESANPPLVLAKATEIASLQATDHLLPFGPTFQTYAQNLLIEHIQRCSTALQIVLQNDCGLGKTLDAFQDLYLSADGSTAGYIDVALFRRINEGRDDWHDKHLVLDLFQEAYQATVALNCDQLVIRSSRTHLQSYDGQRSVVYLDDLNIEYIIPWTISNLVSQASLEAYRALGLWLRQIRWAKHELETCTFPDNAGIDLRPEARHTTLWRGLRFNLLYFVNTIYDHFVSCVIQPHTHNMRANLDGTLEEMIDKHSSYIDDVIFACLLHQKLSVLKDTIVSILDICINLQRSYLKNRDIIVLKNEFVKHVQFLLAGLQGLASSGAKSAAEMSLLADRLEGLNLNRD